MAVYKRTYKGYSGIRTSASWRWSVLTRYSHSRLFHSKLLALFLTLCGFYPLMCIAYMYLLNNRRLPAMLGIPVSQMLMIDGRFFYFFCIVQGGLALLLTAIVGPNLIWPDMVNGGLALYFCRPFSRVEYIAGKHCVMLWLLSLVTWIPGLFVFLMNQAIVGGDWARANLYLAGALLLGMILWITVLSLIALALSSAVKGRIAASAFILALFFAGAGFGAAINDVMRTSYGTLVDLGGVARMIWADLLRYDAGFSLPVMQAWLVLGAAGLLSCWVLAGRIRPFEIVK